jgi:hypothetical protein
MTTTNPPNGQEWSRTDIYLEGSTGPMPPRILPSMTDRLAERLFTLKFNGAWKEDTEQAAWEQLDETPQLTPAEITLIVNEGIRCPICQDGRDWVRFRGWSTGVPVSIQMGHGCQRYVCVGQLWRLICPEKFRRGRLGELKPSTISLLPTAKQVEYFQLMQKYPDDSYLLHGKSGSGKTHLACCLMFRAVERWSLAWVANEELPWLIANESGQLVVNQAKNKDMGEQSVFFVENTGLLLDQIQYARQPIKGATNPGLPVVTVERILHLRKKGMKVTLVLDELDKFVPTETRIEALERLVGTVNLGGGQLIAMSNTSEKNLEKKWQDFPSGEPILRRIGGPADRGHSLEFVPR